MILVDHLRTMVSLRCDAVLRRPMIVQRQWAYLYTDGVADELQAFRKLLGIPATRPIFLQGGIPRCRLTDVQWARAVQLGAVERDYLVARREWKGGNGA
jgi:hypothetical protein